MSKDDDKSLQDIETSQDSYLTVNQMIGIAGICISAAGFLREGLFSKQKNQVKNEFGDEKDK